MIRTIAIPEPIATPIDQRIIIIPTRAAMTIPGGHQPIIRRWINPGKVRMITLMTLSIRISGMMHQRHHHHGEILPQSHASQNPQAIDQLPKQIDPQKHDLDHQQIPMPAIVMTNHRSDRISVVLNLAITPPVVPARPSPSQFTMIGMSKMMNGIN